MLDHSFEQLTQTFLLGLMLLALGLTKFLLGSTRSRMATLVSTLVILSLGSGFAYLMESYVSPVALGIAVISVSLLAEGLSSAVFHRGLQHSIPVVFSRMMIFGLLTLAGLLVIVGGIAWNEYELQRQIDADMKTIISDVAVPEFDDRLTQIGLTDSDNAIPLRLPTSAMLEKQPHELEDGYLTRNHYIGALIRREPATYQSNCHGWVFTGGQYWITGGTVDQILQDNGYVKTTRPVPGDLIIYRDNNGIPSHTGLVRYCTEGMPSLIESKWGSIGVYLHQAKDCPFGTVFDYYHSRRNGHLLKSIPLRPQVSENRPAAP